MSNGTPTTGGDGVTTAPVLASGPADITFWSDKVGGVQHSDLLDASGTPISQVTSSDGADGFPVGTIPDFQGPDDVTEMWADAGAGTRYRITTGTLGGSVTELRTSVADLIGTVAALTIMIQNSMGAVVYDDGTASWPERPAGDSRVFQWVGPSVPTAGTPYMEEGDLWVNTSAA